MSTALYNRYRPTTFAQVVGQEHVTDALRQALRTGRLHHAYLFSGPRGCGKTSSARILAASLNCEKGPTPDPCGVCEQCVAIRTGSSMDVTEIDAASHGLVDDARDLRERAFFAPASARFKVYVVDEAHMVTAAAFNALLKVVEEPPPYLKFVFATTEPDKVIPTIRSRTHHYAFRLVPPGVLRAHLASICEQEGVKVDPAVLPLVVRAGAGSVRDSLSVLDQLLAGAGEEGLTYERAVALLGMTDGILLDETVDALAARDGAALFTVVDRVVSSGHDPRRFATDLLDRLRDLIVIAAVPDAAERGLLDAFSPDQVERMREQASRMGPAELSRTADVVHSGLVEMRGTASPRLMLELILARALLPGASSDPAALAVRLERLERQAALGAGRPAAEAAGAGHAPTDPAFQANAPHPGAPGMAPQASTGPMPQPPAPPPVAAPPTGAPSMPAPGQAGGAPPAAMPAPSMSPASMPPGSVPPGSVPPGSVPPGSVPGASMPAGLRPPAPMGAPQAVPQGQPPRPAAPAPGAGSRINAAGLTAIWDEVLALAARRSRRTHAILKDYASVADVRGDEVVLAFSAPAMARIFSQGNNVDIFAGVLAEKLGGTWRVSIAGSGPGGPGGRPGGPGVRPGGPAGPGRPGMAPGPGGTAGDYGAAGGAAAPGPFPGPYAPPAPANGPSSQPMAAYGPAGGPGTPPGGMPLAAAPVPGQAGGYANPAVHPAGPPGAVAAQPSWQGPGVGMPSPAGPGMPASHQQVHPVPAAVANAPTPVAAAAGGGPQVGVAERAAGGNGLADGNGMGGAEPGGVEGRFPGQGSAPSAASWPDDSVDDEPSLDDEDAPADPNAAQTTEEAAVALLRSTLGATVIEQS